MGLVWCHRLPVEVVLPSERPKPITLILPYYENPHFLWTQIDHWFTFPAILRAFISVIIVDDGSPVPAQLPVVRPFQSMRLFQIEQDVRWNWLAARNIGFHHAADEWCLVTDMDHMVPVETAEALVFGSHDPKTIYGLSRLEHTGEELAPHPNSWFLTKQMFWRVGGYDETLSGCYGTDGDWRRRCAATARMAILTDHLIRHEHEGDSSTTRYLRKQPQDAKARQLMAKRTSGWTPKTLSFPYHEVLPDHEVVQ